jgi:hypothetical protein
MWQMKRYNIVHVKFASRLWMVYKLKRIEASHEASAIRTFKRWANKEYGKGNYGIVKMIYYGENHND